MVRPYRRQASSHRGTMDFKPYGVPVGAGLPAIGPDQANNYQPSSSAQRSTSTSSSPCNFSILASTAEVSAIGR
ncbi:hypothetical protein F1602_17285 [Pseudomonas putida]|nr:hypothetical protein HV87_25360 [Pseudomonas aeruginosa]QEQ88964.1 hypothetical protein F1602_17285 [Pseudomonas putida]